MTDRPKVKREPPAEGAQAWAWLLLGTWGRDRAPRPPGCFSESEEACEARVRSQGFASSDLWPPSPGDSCPSFQWSLTVVPMPLPVRWD